MHLQRRRGRIAVLMFKIIGLITLLAGNGAGEMVSTNGFASMALCTAAMPQAKEELAIIMKELYGLEADAYKVELRCEFQSTVEQDGPRA
jgi:hypothetical protein